MNSDALFLLKKIEMVYFPYQLDKSKSSCWLIRADVTQQSDSSVTQGIYEFLFLFQKAKPDIG